MLQAEAARDGKGEITALAWNTKNQAILATASSDGTLHVQDTRTQRVTFNRVHDSAGCAGCRVVHCSIGPSGLANLTVETDKCTAHS